VHNWRSGATAECLLGHDSLMEANGSTASEVTLTLDGAEALVLFDTLSGWEKDGTLRRVCGDRPSGWPSRP
jgi:hypothetical protein